MTDTEILERAEEIKQKRLEVINDFLPLRKFVSYDIGEETIDCVLSHFSINPNTLNITIELTPLESTHQPIVIAL